MSHALMLTLGDYVRVGSTKPSGERHPHAGQVGVLTKCFEDSTTMVRLGSGRFILVSSECLQPLETKGSIAVRDMFQYINTPSDVRAFKENPYGFIGMKRSEYEELKRRASRSIEGEQP